MIDGGELAAVDGRVVIGEHPAELAGERRLEVALQGRDAGGMRALGLGVDVVTELLQRGAKIDSATKKGNTALHIASLAGQVNIFKIICRIT